MRLKKSDKYNIFYDDFTGYTIGKCIKDDNRYWHRNSKMDLIKKDIYFSNNSNNRYHL